MDEAPAIGGSIGGAVALLGAIVAWFRAREHRLAKQLELQLSEQQLHRDRIVSLETALKLRDERIDTLEAELFKLRIDVERLRWQHDDTGKELAEEKAKNEHLTAENRRLYSDLQTGNISPFRKRPPP